MIVLIVSKRKYSKNKLLFFLKVTTWVTFSRICRFETPLYYCNAPTWLCICEIQQIVMKQVFSVVIMTSNDPFSCWKLEFGVRVENVTCHLMEYKVLIDVIRLAVWPTSGSGCVWRRRLPGRTHTRRQSPAITAALFKPPVRLHIRVRSCQRRSRAQTRDRISAEKATECVTHSSMEYPAAQLAEWDTSSNGRRYYQLLRPHQLLLIAVNLKPNGNTENEM